MEDTHQNSDQSTFKKKKIIHDYEEEFNRGTIPLTSNTFNNVFKNLSTPRFLGSYHLKEAINPKYKTLNNILTGNFQLKNSKYLKSIIFNPITITLIVIAIIFNLFLLFTMIF
jgi:hypothetical protein